MSLTRLAHQLIAEHFATQPKGCAVDATLGNGNDTEFLLRLGFKRVIGFDIQNSAIESTKARLTNAQLSGAELHKLGHQHMQSIVQQAVDCIMFNLGYLPKADKDVTTTTNTTLLALDIALNLIDKNGIVSVICYPGHPEGARETRAVTEWISRVGEEFEVSCHQATKPSPATPILYLIRKGKH